jgi:hypothetical protein
MEKVMKASLISQHPFVRTGTKQFIFCVSPQSKCSTVYVLVVQYHASSSHLNSKSMVDITEENVFWDFLTDRSVITRTGSCATSAISSNLWSRTQRKAHVHHVDRRCSCISWISFKMRFQPPDDGMRHGSQLRQTLTQINNCLWCWPGFTVWLIHTVWRQRVSVGDIIPRVWQKYKTGSVISFAYWQNWKLLKKKKTTHSYNVWNVVMRVMRFSQRR